MCNNWIDAKFLNCFSNSPLIKTTQFFSQKSSLFTCYYLPSPDVQINESNAVVQQANNLFCGGISWASIEPHIARGYFRACGNANILRWLSRQGLKCSLTHILRTFAWGHLCSVFSYFNEIDRDPAIQGTALE